MRRLSVANTVSANTAGVISEVFRAPKEDSVVESMEEKAGGKSTLGMPAPKPAPEPVKETVVRSHFKLIFISVLCLTVGTLIAELLMVFWVDSPNAAQQNLISGLESIWKGGVGAILGLLGGKVT